MMKSKLFATLAVLAAVLTAYKASDYCAAGLNYWQQQSEWYDRNYRIGTFKCYVCFHGVDYCQAKGVSPQGTKAVCGNCGHTNTYRGDTLPSHSYKGSFSVRWEPLPEEPETAPHRLDCEVAQ